MACTVYPAPNGPRMHKGFLPHCLTLGAGAGRLGGGGVSLGADTNNGGALMTECKAAGSPLRHNSHVGDFEPGDGQAGDWSRERLIRMDRECRRRLECALRRGLESRTAAAARGLSTR
jgi:hypothetical protein